MRRTSVMLHESRVALAEDIAEAIYTEAMRSDSREAQWLTGITRAEVLRRALDIGLIDLAGQYGVEIPDVNIYEDENE